jgi:tRNA A64-2'-O-ribosylphosphate transferase
LATQDPKAVQMGVNVQQRLPLRMKEENMKSGSFAVEEPMTEHETVESGDPLNQSSPPPDIPSSIFTNLLTAPTQAWTFHRTLRSMLPTHPSGIVTGTATFTPCNLPSTSPPTLLYAEEGDFITNSGLRFTARRKYVYQLLRAPEDVHAEPYIIVKFFDDEKLPRAKVEDGVGTNGEGIGGLFVEMGQFALTSEAVWEAKNREQHLCAEDLYTASWKFSEGMMMEGGTEEKWWEVRYDVTGPNKDYVSMTRYVRI